MTKGESGVLTVLMLAYPDPPPHPESTSAAIAVAPRFFQFGFTNSSRFAQLMNDCGVVFFIRLSLTPSGFSRAYGKTKVPPRTGLGRTSGAATQRAPAPRPIGYGIFLLSLCAARRAGRLATISRRAIRFLPLTSSWPLSTILGSAPVGADESLTSWSSVFAFAFDGADTMLLAGQFHGRARPLRAAGKLVQDGPVQKNFRLPIDSPTEPHFEIQAWLHRLNTQRSSSACSRRLP